MGYSKLTMTTIRVGNAIEEEDGRKEGRMRDEIEN